MDKNEISQFLKGIELFRNLTDEELNELAGHIREKKCNAGYILFRENSPREDIYVIYEGEVELFKRNAYGADTRLALFGRGDFIGEGIWEENSLHSTSAKAVKSTTILDISSGFFQESPATTLKILQNITRVISRRMRNANTRILGYNAQYDSGSTRSESDLLGEREVPVESYYGVQTLRAMENFNISGVTLNFFPSLIEALSMVKESAAEANFELGLLDRSVRDAIVLTCREIQNGKYHNQFVVDMIQGGAGTSTNMNANEVIANRALEMLGHEKGDYSRCHPNNHVNLSQSTNDAYPTSVKIALYNSNRKLVAVLKTLVESFRRKGEEFSHVLKMGRTQLQDAVPMTLGQEFEAYAVTLAEEIERLNLNARLFLEINMGATAIGTGINSEPGYSDKVTRHLRRITGLDLVLASNLVEATQDTGAFVMYSSAVKRMAVKLSKICNDLLLLNSGPRAGFGEIRLPAVQAGSSIMPGKVNPVVPEVVNQIAYQVIGNDLTVTLAAEAGQLQLNAMEPVIVFNILQSMRMLMRGMVTLREKCVLGIEADEERCRELLDGSLVTVTALNPYIGYDEAARVAKIALKTRRTIRDVALSEGVMTEAQLAEAFTTDNLLGVRR